MLRLGEPINAAEVAKSIKRKTGVSYNAAMKRIECWPAERWFEPRKKGGGGKKKVEAVTDVTAEIDARKKAMGIGRRY